jgi:acyl carrier protein
MSSSAALPPTAISRQDVEDAVIREFQLAAGKHAPGSVSLASDYRKDLGINSMGFTSAISLLEKRLGISLLEHLEQLSMSTKLSDVASTVVYAVKHAKS